VPTGTLDAAMRRELRKVAINQGLAALVGGAIVAGALIAFGYHRDNTLTRVVADLPADPAASVGLTPRQIYQRDADGVVFVTAKVVEEDTSPFNLFPTRESGTQTGSGIVIASNGTILTNAHVIAGAVKITVQLADGKMVPATVIGKDPDDDLALLRVNPAGERLDVLPLGNSNTVEVGDPTVAIGNPFDLQRTLTTGVVSALQRAITAPDGFEIDNVIQTDAPINPGNSGGPLINAEGQVIGINSQIQTDGSDGSIGLGFAIPINTAKFVIPQLAAHGRVSEGYLGVATASISAADASLHLGSSYGALIETVVAGSPAARAGLRGSPAPGSPATLPDGITQVAVGGDIIVSLNGAPIDSNAALENAIIHDSPGQTVTVGIVRGKRHLTVRVVLASRPESLPRSG
jgi:S1-C subfamily serine protease